LITLLKLIYLFISIKCVVIVRKHTTNYLNWLVSCDMSTCPSIYSSPWFGHDDCKTPTVVLIFFFQNLLLLMFLLSSFFLMQRVKERY